jgi:hypothetical protein
MWSRRATVVSGRCSLPCDHSGLNRDENVTQGAVITVGVETELTQAFTVDHGCAHANDEDTGAAGAAGRAVIDTERDDGTEAGIRQHPVAWRTENRSVPVHGVGDRGEGGQCPVTDRDTSDSLTTQHLETLLAIQRDEALHRHECPPATRSGSRAESPWPAGLAALSGNDHGGHAVFMTTLDLRTVAECAALAPSVHNSQPWQFISRADTLEVRADRERRLGYLDPDGRLMHISCGAAIEFARLAVRAEGFDCTVELLPDPADKDLLARVVVGAGLDTSGLEQVLVQAIPRRYTDRGDYDAQLVPPALIAEAQTVLATYGVWVKVIDDAADRTGLALVLADAEAAETMSPEYVDELARWVHPGDDGLPLPAVSPPLSDVVTDMPQRAFVNDGRRLRPDAGVPPLVIRNTVVMLGTKADTPTDWLTAGAGLAWLQLRAAVDNIVTQPLGPATDFPAARARLRSELKLLGHPQFVLRMGYGAGRPWTRRRSTETTFAADR